MGMGAPKFDGSAKLSAPIGQTIRADAPKSKTKGKVKSKAKPATKAEVKAAVEKTKKLPAVATTPMHFHKQMKELRSILSNEEVISEKSTIMMTRSFLGAILEAVKVAEKTYRKKPTPHNGYAFNALTTQAHQFAKELRLMQTQEQRLGDIVDDAVMAGLKRLVFQISQNFIQINAVVDTNLSSKKSERAAAKKIKRKTESAADDIGGMANEIADMIKEEILKNA